jgi:hypothetical protein
VARRSYSDTVAIGSGRPLPFDPFDGRPLRLRVAARPLDDDAWIVLDDRAGADLAEKDRLLADPAVHKGCVATTGTELVDAAAEELLGTIEDWLARHAPEHLARRSSRLPDGLSALDRAGRIVPEDWCLLDDRTTPGVPVLVGATLCFPNRWRLRDKLGLPLRDVHSPVPGYAERIGGATDHAVGRVRPGEGIWRINWSVHDDPRLHQPTGHHDPHAGERAVDIATEVYLRIERQTLVRLPTTRHVVFGIKTMIDPLGEVVAADPSLAERLAFALETMDHPMRAYKSLERLAEPVIAWLKAR